MKIYMDNASTTKLDVEVINKMKGAIENIYGNPSSLHMFGREAKTEIEKARKNIARILNTKPDRIIFTSGGTESNNWIINKSVETLGVNHIITSKIEHSAILKPLEYLEKTGKVKITYINLDPLGHIDFQNLEQELKKTKDKTMVSLMHANNEIGNITNIHFMGELCKKYNAKFHSDTAQTMGFYKFDLENINLDFCICSAHKFHGPKGIGFIYINDKVKLDPFIHGGKQEFALRAGTENVIGIIGMNKAMEIAYKNLEKNKAYISSLKLKMLNKLKENIPNILFNGDCENLNNSLYKIINIKIPSNIPNDMIILKLDIKGIAVSSGSACSSGTAKGSHVIENLYKHDDNSINRKNKSNIRISLSKYNNEKEIDIIVKEIKNICDSKAI